MKSKEIFDAIRPQILMIIPLFIRYISYSALVPVVLISLSVLLIITSTIFGNLNFVNLTFFSFINPIFGKNSYSISEKEIMQIFGFLSLMFWILSFIIKKILEFILKRKIQISLKKKIYYYSIPITIIFIVALICVPIIKMSEDQNRYDFIPIIAIFYLITIISLIIHITLNHFSYWLSEKIKSDQIKIGK